MDGGGNGHQRRRGFDTSRPIRSFIEVVRGVFIEPAEFFAGVRATREEERGVGVSLLFAGICFVIFLPLSVLAAPLDPLTPEIFSRTQDYPRGDGAGVALSFVLAPVFAVFSVYLYAAIQHLSVLSFVREQRGFWATFLVVTYGGSALALLSWIPVLSYLLSLYAIYVYVVGLREMHGTTTLRRCSRCSFPTC